MEPETANRLSPLTPLTPEHVGQLLQETSRTFALAVPLLPPETRHAVGLAYLLFRVADTLEDAATWKPSARKSALSVFARMLEEGPADRRVVEDWLARGVTTHAGYARLTKLTPELLAEVDRLPAAARTTLRTHARRTALGMRDMIDEADLETTNGLGSLEALRRYCYIVAGIVGELLTELFVQDAPSLASVKPVLTLEERAFGEGLQLVNILKDELGDRAEGRSFLPAGVSRNEVLDLAAEDLRAARRYIQALEQGGASRGVVAFTSLPCELAERTLEVLRVEGPGAKVPRPHVLAMFARYTELAASGTPHVESTGR